MSALKVSETNHEEPIRGLIGIHQEYITFPKRRLNTSEGYEVQRVTLLSTPIPDGETTRRKSSHKLLHATFCTSEIVSETTYVSSSLRGASTRNLLPTQRQCSTPTAIRCSKTTKMATVRAEFRRCRPLLYEARTSACGWPAQPHSTVLPTWLFSLLHSRRAHVHNGVVSLSILRSTCLASMEYCWFCCNIGAWMQICTDGPQAELGSSSRPASYMSSTDERS